MTIAADTMHSPAEAAARLTTLLGAKITEETLEGWRGGARAQPLKSVKILGRIKYRESDLVDFAKQKLTPTLPTALQDADRLLPGPILARTLSQEAADRVYALLCEGRGVFAVGSPAPHAARIDGATQRAAEALIGLVREVAHHAVVAIAMDRAAATFGGLAAVPPDALTQELNDLAVDFEHQRAQGIADERAAKARIVVLRERHRPLRDAVGAKLDQLQHERSQLASKRNALTKTGALEASPASLLAAGVPPSRMAAVRQAIGEPDDIAAEVDALNQRVHTLSHRIEQLQRFQTAEPGDHTALAGWPDLAALADNLKA